MNVIFHPLFFEHDTGNHPENNSRIEPLLEFFESEGHEFIKPRNGEQFLELAHDPDYVKKVKEMSRGGGGYLDGDTLVSAKTYDAAIHAVGATIDAADKEGFAVVRPPGHHASKDQGMGFCVFNNIAVAAKKLADDGKKVLILDIDVHHGNGTEEIVMGDDRIKFISLHQSPLYPGTGIYSQGNCVNFPLSPGTTDKDYISILNSEVEPHIKRFNPDIIGVSLGFDAYYRDVGWVAGNQLRVTQKTYSRIREILLPYKTFFVLEGGYNPDSLIEGSKTLFGL